ncbi:hypothetical protein FQN57_001790 [Myotisia sp. PD_48]|nr:hypothetical protein FQN57_001790 [Myotisia sp. PD_48]
MAEGNTKVSQPRKTPLLYIRPDPLYETEKPYFMDMPVTHMKSLKQTNAAYTMRMATLQDIRGMPRLLLRVIETIKIPCKSMAIRVVAFSVDMLICTSSTTGFSRKFNLRGWVRFKTTERGRRIAIDVSHKFIEIIYISEALIIREKAVRSGFLDEYHPSYPNGYMNMGVVIVNRDAQYSDSWAIVELSQHWSMLLESPSAWASWALGNVPTDTGDTDNALRLHV